MVAPQGEGPSVANLIEDPISHSVRVQAETSAEARQWDQQRGLPVPQSGYAHGRWACALQVGDQRQALPVMPCPALSCSLYANVLKHASRYAAPAAVHLPTITDAMLTGAGSGALKHGHASRLASQAGMQPAALPAVYLPATSLSLLSTWASARLHPTDDLAADGAAPAVRRCALPV